MKGTGLAKNSSKNLSGAAAIVTESSSSIGLAVARRLAADGAAAINFHSYPEPALALADEIRRGRGRAIAVGANVTDESGNQHL